VSASDGHRTRLELALLALLPTVLLFGALELVLRLVGFQYSEIPLEVKRFTDDPQGVVEREIAWQNRSGAERFVRDPKQFWVPSNSPLDRHTLVAEEDVTRIAALGDSCTAYCVSTRDSFPKLTERLLNARGARRYEVLNAGVASYSSHQGLQRLRHAVLPFAPDLLTVYFGWNDHWITGTPDRDVELRDEWETSLVNALGHLRLYQAGAYLLAKLRAGNDLATDPTRPQPVVRVSLADYAANLREIIRVARDAGMQVLLITAPQDLADWHNDDLQPLATEELVALHADYNDHVRAVAAETGTPLLDLDALIEAQKPRRLIAKDGIHLNPQGCRFTANAVAAKIAELQRHPGR
jgi:lysophospholipase L1-like esterase